MNDKFDEAAIMIAGDICPIYRNTPLFTTNDAQIILHDLHDQFMNADLRIANLECPLIGTSTPITKAGPILGVPEQCINGLRSLKLTAVSLANNHVFDHGAAGLFNTRRLCQENGIATFGAGSSLAEASEVLIVESNGLKIGFLGLSEREFSIAGERHPGACPMDEILVHDLLCQRKDWDVLIVLLHAGANMNSFPSPKLQRFCRFLIRLGAAAVICQHSHCLGAYEIYQEGLIVYGQGNFLFDWLPNPGLRWNEGMLIQLRLTRPGLGSWEFIPYLQGGESPGVRRADPSRTQELLELLETWRKQIGDPLFVRQQWSKYCKTVEKDYYHGLLGRKLRGRIMRRLTDELGLDWHPFKPNHQLIVGNLIRCESHREVLETILFGEEQ